MMQRLANKILAPHRHNNDSAEEEKREEGVTTITGPTLEKKETIITGPVVEKVSSPATLTHVVDEGIVKRETIVKPAIVEEKVRIDSVVEVQPIIHREVDQPIVHHIEQHVVEPVAPFVGGTVKKEPIIEEHVNTRIVNEIQPIVHREVAVPKVEKVEEHIQEHIVNPTQHTNETKHKEGLATDVKFSKEAIVKPAIVDETVRTDTVVEVQPIVHRDVERTIINHIEQHIVEPEAPFVGGSYRNEAIIDEHVNTQAVEEIQPVVHREIAVQKLEKVEEHKKETVVAPTQHTNAVEEKKGRISEITHDKDAIVKPIIMDEKVRTDKVIEVQPIVHRQIDQPVVHHIEQHIQEPAAPFVGGTYHNKPIIDEHLKTTVVDEVQPVVHKEKAIRKLEKVEEHLKEHVVAPTEHTHDTKTTTGHVSDIVHSKNAIVKPEIVDETIRTDTLVEVQPIVHKTIEQPVVHHIEEHVREPVAASVAGTITNKPIIEEKVITREVDEIQPVVHREVAVPKVTKVEEHVEEKVVVPTQHTEELAETIRTETSSTSPSLLKKEEKLADKQKKNVALAPQQSM